MKWDGINRRRFIRVNFPFTLHIYPHEHPPISAYTEDVSEGGLATTLEEKLPVASEVVLEIHAGEEPVTCKGKIVWVRERESEYLPGKFFYDTGIAFVKISEQAINIIRNCVEELERKKKEEENS